MALIDNGDDALVIAPKLQALARKLGIPQGTSDDDRKKLLPLDTDATLPVEVHARWPSALKPFAAKITTKTDRTRRVGKQFEVGGRRYSGIKKKGPTVPLVKKYLPHGNVPREFAVQADMMKAARDPPCEIDNSLQERTTGNNNLTGKLKGTDKRLKFDQASRSARLEGQEQIAGPG